MTTTEIELQAGLRVLICMAKADGVLHDEERKALDLAFEATPLPEELTLDDLLADDTPVEQELALIESEEARREVYKSAFSMANADGECSAEEKALLEQIHGAFGLSADETTALQRLFADTGDAGPSAIKPIPDPAQREAAIRKETLKCAIVSAVLGAFPVPGLAIATDLAVVALQVTLVRDIGAMHGRVVDKKTARNLLYGLGLGTGARLAVNNLAKLFPGWGSAVGATTSFASTFGLGKVVGRYFEGEDLEALKKEFSAAEKEGKQAYKEAKSDIDAQGEKAKAALDALNAKLKSGELTQAEYEQEVAALAA